MSARYECGLTKAEHDEIKADPARWASEMRRHRRDPQTALEFAEHSCGGTFTVIYDRALWDALEGGF